VRIGSRLYCMSNMKNIEETVNIGRRISPLLNLVSGLGIY